MSENKFEVKSVCAADIFPIYNQSPHELKLYIIEKLTEGPMWEDQLKEYSRSHFKNKLGRDYPDEKYANNKDVVKYKKNFDEAFERRFARVSQCFRDFTIKKHHRLKYWVLAKHTRPPKI